MRYQGGLETHFLDHSVLYLQRASAAGIEIHSSAQFLRLELLVFRVELCLKLLSFQFSRLVQTYKQDPHQSSHRAIILPVGAAHYILPACQYQVGAFHFLWSDGCDAANPPIEEVGPSVVFVAAFDGEQGVGARLNQNPTVCLQALSTTPGRERKFRAGPNLEEKKSCREPHPRCIECETGSVRVQTHTGDRHRARPIRILAARHKPIFLA